MHWISLEKVFEIFLSEKIFQEIFYHSLQGIFQDLLLDRVSGA